MYQTPFKQLNANQFYYAWYLNRSDLTTTILFNLPKTLFWKLNISYSNITLSL